MLRSCVGVCGSWYSEPSGSWAILGAIKLSRFTILFFHNERRDGRGEGGSFKPDFYRCLIVSSPFYSAEAKAVLPIYAGGMYLLR